MAGTGPPDLHVLAEEFLAACIEALDTIPDYAPTLLGAPANAFVGPGITALDCCEQLVVHVGAITEGDAAPGFPAASDARINRVELVVTASRCVPIPDPKTGTPPSAQAQSLAAEQINADKWALWNHIYSMINAHLLFDKCCDVIWGALRAQQTAGGCGGSILSITVCYDGYEEALGS
jgi:hypothetical protein